MNDLIQSSPTEFGQFLQEHGIRRFHFVYDRSTEKVLPSHAVLQPIAEFIQNDKRDFMAHEGIFFQITRQHNILQAAFVHRTNRGQGAGGTRFWRYDTMEDFLRDGLRLSKGMTHKNALAGLWWGGGKGVIANDPRIESHDPAVRAAVFQEYGELITAIRGCYVTAEDVGTDTTDIGNIFVRTRFTTCIPPEVGGSGNPSAPTAAGVVRGMEAALKFLDGSTLANKTVVVQGLGHVGAPLVRFLFEKGVRQVIGCDISEETVAAAKRQFANNNLQAYAVKRGDNSILAADCDIVAPCATGAILNPQTIPHIKARIVCGAANNQLEDPSRDDQLLQKQGVLYVPDFLVNRMGIVNCANEQYGYVKNDAHFMRHLDKEWEHSIYQMTLKVLSLSKETGEPPAHAAIRLANELSLEPHPIWGHRGQQIIESLVADRWWGE